MEPTPVVRETLAALRPGRAWGEVRLVDEVGSTNLEVRGLPVWSAVVARRQSAGRGRRGRAWSDTEGHGIACSLLAEVDVDGQGDGALGWVPLATGLAVRDCLVSLGLDAALKWPNDVLAGPSEQKVCGILCEALPPSAKGERPRVVVGVGVNLDHEAADLPVPTATSLRLLARAAGRPAPTRDEVVPALLDALRDRLDPLDLTSLRRDYREASATLGREVDVHLPDGSVLRARAEGVDDDGRLRVAGPQGSATVSAGDVHHLRHQPPS